jgi:type II secretory pathway pseudopilin PulG
VTTSRPSYHRGDDGYAVLLAIFMVATMLLLAATATPNILTQGRRLREQETIWRGNQYVRAIRLYYQKNREYPSSLDDLTKANAAGAHFLRKAYKDPMNSSDGSWRLIYITLPSGQLEGSVHYHSLQEMAVAAAFAAQSGSSITGFASQLFGQVNPGLNGGTPGAQPGQLNGLQSGQFGPPGLGGQNSQNSTMSSTQPGPLNAVDSPVFGGFVIGVASKVKQPSLIVYQGGKSYFEWEFIWNPLTNGGGAAIPGLNASSPQGAALNNPGVLLGGANGNNNTPGAVPLPPQRDPGPQQVP